MIRGTTPTFKITLDEKFDLDKIQELWITFKAGHEIKLDYSKMIWNGSIWIYDGRIGIDFRNSPEEVIISVL